MLSAIPTMLLLKETPITPNIKNKKGINDSNVAGESFLTILGVRNCWKKITIPINDKLAIPKKVERSLAFVKISEADET